MAMAIAQLFTAWIVGGCTLAISFLLIRKKGRYLLYMTLTSEQRNTDEVLALRAQYKKALWRFFLLLLLTSGLFFLWTSISSYQVILLTAWCTFALVGQYRIIHRYVGLLYDIKVKNDWLVKKTKMDVPFDTALTGHKRIRPVSFLLFLFPIWLMVGETIWFAMEAASNKGVLVILVTSYLMLFFFIFLYRKLAHSGNRRYCEDCEIDMTLNRVSKRSYTGLVIFEALLQNMYCFSLMLLMNRLVRDLSAGKEKVSFLPGFILSSVIFLLISVAALVLAMNHVRRARNLLLAGKELLLPEDEDACWRNGYYYNPEDMNTFVEDRTPLANVGVTVNMARPLGRASVYVLVTVGILCLLLGIGLMPLDFGKVSADSVADGVEVKACFYYKEYVAFDDVLEVSLLTECPKLSRLFGAGKEHVALGDYHFKGYGTGRAMITRDADCYIMVKRKNGRYVCISLPEDEKTAALYALLLARASR